jgi:alcohol dehydrogenase class IV
LRLRAEIGIPSTLKALGVSEEMVEQLAPMAAEDPTCAGNPVPVGESELASIYLNAIQGLLG